MVINQFSDIFSLEHFRCQCRVQLVLKQFVLMQSYMSLYNSDILCHCGQLLAHSHCWHSLFWYHCGLFNVKVLGQAVHVGGFGTNLSICCIATHMQWTRIHVKYWLVDESSCLSLLASLTLFHGSSFRSHDEHLENSLVNYNYVCFSWPIKLNRPFPGGDCKDLILILSTFLHDIPAIQ